MRLCGGETVGAVVDGLCNYWVGVRLDRGGYVIADWEDIEVEEDAEEVVRTEQGEVLARKSEEESVPNDLEEAAEISFDEAKSLTEDYRDFLAQRLTENQPRPIGPHWFCEYAKNRFIAGAKWQAEQDQETIELAEDHAYLAGAVNEREKILSEAVEGEITKDNRGNNVVRAGVFNKDFEYGDKVRVIVLKKED